MHECQLIQIIGHHKAYRNLYKGACVAFKDALGLPRPPKYFLQSLITGYLLPEVLLGVSFSPNSLLWGYL